MRAAPISRSRCGHMTDLFVIRLLLLSVLLFGAGPQFGSLDADRDGSPEVPIIVLDRGNTVSVLPTVPRIHQSVFISRLAPLPSDQVPIRVFEDAGKQSESRLSHLSLLSFGLLRC